MFGDLITQQWACAALPVLMEHAKASKIIRYEELRTAISATTNRKMGSVCGIISTTLYQLEHNELEQQWQKERIPRLGNIVIRMNGKPGEWMCEQITGDRKVAPPWEEYEAKYVNRVFEYAHWDAVLEALVSEADKAMETELVELERADQALKKIDGARGKSKRQSKNINHGLLCLKHQRDVIKPKKPWLRQGSDTACWLAFDTTKFNLVLIQTD